MSASLALSARRQLAASNVSIVVGVVAAFGTLVPIGPLVQCTAVIGLIVLVGSLLASRLELTSCSLAQRLSICLGLGFLAFLVITAAIGAVFPHLDIARPLSRWPLVTAWCVLDVGILAWLVRTGDDTIKSMLSGTRGRDLAWAAVLAVPPLLALVGMDLLNAGSGAALADVVGVLVVVLTLAAVVLPARRWCPPRILLLTSAFITAAWQGTFRGGWLAGFDVQHEYYIGTLAIHQAQFPLHHYVDPYGGMLSLTVWPTALNSLASVSLRTTLGLTPTIFLALALLVTWSTLRGRVSPRVAAALCALFVVGSTPLLQQLPQVSRQCSALFFFALLIFAVLPGKLSTSTARTLAIASGIGIALTHYSSAYLAAGAVIVGCVLAAAAKTPRETRVLTVPVTAVIAGAAAIWGGFVAKTGTSINEIAHSIRTDGFQLLPGTGSLVSRWLSGASVSQLVNANVIYNADVNLRTGQYSWMHVVPAAQGIALVNDPAPVSHGVSIVGPALSAGSTSVTQLLLFASIISVVCALWWCWRRDRALAGVAGIGLFFVVAAGIARFSQTLGVDFGPSRVEAQAYLAFVVTVAVVCGNDTVTARLSRLRASIRSRELVVGVVAIAVGVAVLTSTGLIALIEVHQQLPAPYSSRGEQAARLLTPSDIAAANWLEVNRSTKAFVQSDRMGALALDDFGYNDRTNFFASLDPIIVDNASWLFAYRTNIVDGSARGGNNARTGVFRFPASYFSSMRPTLYTSGTDLVYGSVPKALATGS